MVTDSGDTRKWIDSGKNGFVIPVKSPSVLAEKIIYLLNNKDLGQRMGQANRRLVEERADYETEMEKMGNLYQALVESSKK